MAKGKRRTRRGDHSPKRQRATRRSTRPAILPLKSIGGLALLCTLLWLGYTGFQDRTYIAFSEAGDGAFERRHYTYAVRMYREALSEAERIDPGGPKVSESLSDLSRTYLE